MNKTLNPYQWYTATNNSQSSTAQSDEVSCNAVLFSEPAIMQDWLSLDKAIPKDAFQNIRNNYATPEHINDSPQTAPSKQILKIAPFYDKTSDGISIVQETGLQKIRENCPHFNDWLKTIEALKT